MCGPDVQGHVEAFTPYVEAGFSEAYVANVGPHYKQMFSVYADEVLPAVRERLRTVARGT
jgi:hypothetical protein